MATNFIEFPIETDPEQMIDDAIDQLRSQFPGWEPSPGELAVWIIQVCARMTEELAELAADVPTEIFQRFGEVILGVPPLEAAVATAETTWTMRDNAGYTIAEGTLVGIRVTGDEVIGFTVRDTVVVPPGSTATAAGEVVIEAVEPGEHADGADGTVELVDAVIGVDTIALVAPAAGGQDAEEPDVYLDRLAQEAELLAPRPILAPDVEVLARRVAGVARALALDTYDNVTETYDNEKTVTVAVADEDGEALDTATKNEVAALLEARREINFVFYVRDPTYTTIDVQFEITTHAGFDQATVEQSVIDAVTAYLDPANWAGPPYGEGFGIWRDVGTLYRHELISLIDTVAGVDRVVDVQLAEDPNALGTADVVLNGPASLTRPGDITVAP